MKVRVFCQKWKLIISTSPLQLIHRALATTLNKNCQPGNKPCWCHQILRQTVEPLLNWKYMNKSFSQKLIESEYLFINRWDYQSKTKDVINMWKEEKSVQPIKWDCVQNKRYISNWLSICGSKEHWRQKIRLMKALLRSRFWVNGKPSQLRLKLCMQ